MNAWKDYPDKSVLILVFGQIDAEVHQLAPNEMGVILHPYRSFVMLGTRDQAKAQAEQMLRDLLKQATIALPPLPA